MRFLHFFASTREAKLTVVARAARDDIYTPSTYAELVTARPTTYPIGRVVLQFRTTPTHGHTSRRGRHDHCIDGTRAS